MGAPVRRTPCDECEGGVGRTEGTGRTERTRMI